MDRCPANGAARTGAKDLPLESIAFEDGVLTFSAEDGRMRLTRGS